MPSQSQQQNRIDFVIGVLIWFMAHNPIRRQKIQPKSANTQNTIKSQTLVWSLFTARDARFGLLIVVNSVNLLKYAE